MRIIVNPAAGHGRMARYLRQLVEYAAEKGLRIELVETRRPGHARELAAEAALENVATVVAMGGDGTIGEAAGGLVGSESRLGVVSVGTGNDVARSLGLPIKDVRRALEVIVRGRTKRMDIGRDRDSYFISILGVGFPAKVADEANRMRLFRGSAAFFFATYKTLVSMNPSRVRIELDDQVLEKRVTSVIVQNTPFTGGGLLIAPDAQVDDGLFDVVVVEDIGRVDLMFNFPRLYRGSHLRHPKFSAYKTRKITVVAEDYWKKTLDGDLMGEMPVEAEVIPGAIRVLV